MSKKVKLYKINESLDQEGRIEAILKLLGLNIAASAFKHLARKALKENHTPHDFLEELLRIDMNGEEDARIERWEKKAKFPWKKTLEDFDFSYQPKIDRRKINELASCRFIRNKENVVFLGPPGVGKTHLAVGLGIKAIWEGFEPYFLTLRDLIDLIDKTSDDGDKRRVLLRALTRPDLLILDEMDFYEITNPVSEFLSKLVEERYRKSSTIFTSNGTFKVWGKVFGEGRAPGIVDRVLDHSLDNVILIEGKSYRVKDGEDKIKFLKD